MTSRFGKTYNRKGGEANSKFEEVFSNKKPTLTTKWGETTYKAQLGGKKPLLKPGATEVSKRPRLEDSDSEDPFGFDSDEESKTVTSENVSEMKMPEEAAPKPVTAQSRPLVETACWGVELFLKIFSVLVLRNSLCISSVFADKQTSEMDVKNNQPWYKSALAGSQKPVYVTCVSETVLFDNENLSVSQMPVSSFSNLDASMSVNVPGGTHSTQPACSYDGSLSEEMKSADQELPTEPPPEPVDNIPPSPFTLRASNCKKYQRPHRSHKALDEFSDGNSDKPTDPSSAQDKSNSVLSAGASGTAAIANTAAKPAGRGGGRVRDYTVLHPSCLSVCNVTIQDSMDRSIDELVAQPTPADLGEVSLSFFYFFGEDASSEGAMAGKSSYKIKYFGFDDLSESDSDDENSQAKEKKVKRAAAALAALSSSVDSPHTSDSQDSQASSNTGERAHYTHFVTLVRLFFFIYIYIYIYIYSLSPSLSAHFLLFLFQAVLSSGSKDSNSHKDDGLFKAPPPPPKVIKSETIPTRPNQEIVTALKCRKEDKELYTVVQHVKHFNDVVEFGENQEFTDDFEYLETGLKSSQPLNTRCLSIISLATRCAMPSFRMHLRARGKVAQVFKMLSDAPQHPNLALCTAALMYILSRDRLNMDLDRACLELMIKLLELDQDYSGDQDQLTAKEVAKVKEKIRKLCETVHNKHLDLENITTGHLAMEALLSLTSKRAGDWFKEELRLLGGLDHIVDKVKECVENLSQEDDKEKLVESLWGAERCLRVLESVTVQNPENQGYLIAYKDSQLIVSSARALHYCEDMIQRYSRALNNSSLSSSSGVALPHCSFSNVGKAVEDCMRAVIGVLLNLTHDNEWGSTKTGEQEQLIDTALNCVLRVPRYIPQEQRFDVRVLGLGLLINLVEYSSRNRHCLVDMEYTVDDTCLEDSLMQPADPTQLFLERERAAILAEAKTDDLISEAPKPALDQSGEWQETSGEIQWVASETNDSQAEKKEEEDEELDLNKALQHAGKHMEDSIVASYTALLLGCLCQGSQINVTTVRQHLPKGDFSIMTEMLKKFLSFMNLTCAMGTTGQKSISRVIDYLEHC
uniref:Wings apart-like protein homolog n=1 Tax=Poecilia mexicana TaxID=48701 RepID=A0A3B3YL85_9TELE